MTPERIPVGWCHSCPFVEYVGPYGDRRNCRHVPRRLPEDGADPPDWCPLRSRPVLFEVTT